jgi:hypothetical protein
MPDTPPPSSSEDDQPAGEPAWSAAEVMRDRATETRRQRDAAVTELRSAMDDEQIQDDFGIDLGEIER